MPFERGCHHLWEANQAVLALDFAERRVDDRMNRDLLKPLFAKVWK